MLTKADIEKYFLAEKSAGLLFLILGIVALTLALVFIFSLKTNFYKGAAIPLLVLGLLQGIIGYAIYSRSDQQRISTVYAYDMNPWKLKNEELPRIQKVNKNWSIYKTVEIIVLLIAVILIFVYRNNPDKQLLYGLGITLAIEAILMLGTDIMAEKRAVEYGIKLEAFVNKS